MVSSLYIHSGHLQSDIRGKSESDSTSSDDLSSSDEVSYPRIRRRQVSGNGANIACDTCGASSLKLYYQCSKCPLRPEDGTFDICRPCFKRGKWCLTRDHFLIKITVDSKGRPRKQGSVSLVRCQRGLLILVEKLDSVTGKFTPIFRFLAKGRAPSLHDSPAVLHHTRPLMAMPAGYDQVLLADLAHNACSLWTHVRERLPCECSNSSFWK